MPSFFVMKNSGKEDKKMKNNKSAIKRIAALLGKIVREVNIARKKEPLKYEVVADEDFKKFFETMKSDIFFHDHFNTKIAIKRGDVFVVRFEYECGNELQGPHLVVALNDYKANDPMVTVVPLKSYKGILNPRSDVLLGVIPEIGTGKQSVALIIQTKSIDKCRMLEHMSVGELARVYETELLSEDDEYHFRDKTFYRLTKEQFDILLNAFIGFFCYGFIRH